MSAAVRVPAPARRMRRAATIAAMAVCASAAGAQTPVVLRDADVDVPARDLGIPQRFLDHATRAQTLVDIGLTAQDVARKVVETMARLDGKDTAELDAPTEDADRR